MTHLIVHHHLRPGGVTGVVLEEARYLREQGLPHAVLSSESGTSDESWISVPLLDYPCDPSVTGAQLLDIIAIQIARLPQPVVWHIHNPTLGCHPAWTECVALLAEKNERLILHLHDFAEDERPENYRSLINPSRLYLRSARIHYCVLSQRDRNMLMQAGLAPDEVSILPNPLRATTLPPSTRTAPLVLYPCRPIDRKNLGELCLWAAIAGDGAQFATTLLPAKTRNAGNHEHWRNCINQFDLPVRLGIRATDNKLTLDDCVTDCTHIISTSVKEGFGMTFLESVAWNRPLFGRVIPHIQIDLESYGIMHPHLYERVFPVDQPDVDFAKLTVEQQTQVIARARENPESILIEQRGRQLPAADWLSNVLRQRQCTISPDLLAAFSPESHGEMIHDIATRLLDCEPGPVDYLDSRIVTQCFASYSLPPV
jgi:hypothetical protein